LIHSATINVVHNSALSQRASQRFDQGVMLTLEVLAGCST
jgi:hypothetical protein